MEKKLAPKMFIIICALSENKTTKTAEYNVTINC